MPLIDQYIKPKLIFFMNDKFNESSFYSKPLFALCRFSPPDSKRSSPPPRPPSSPLFSLPFVMQLARYLRLKGKTLSERGRGGGGCWAAASVTKKGKGYIDYEGRENKCRDS